jgi:hypothetical protein
MKREHVSSVPGREYGKSINMKNRKIGVFPRFFLQKMTSQQSVNTKIIARLRHVLGHCRENDAFTRKVIVDIVVVDLTFLRIL